MAKLTAHIPLDQAISPDAAGKLIGEVQELLKPIPGFGSQYDSPVLGMDLDSTLTITAGEAELPLLEGLAITYLRL